MTFPHPQSGGEKDRNEDVLKHVAVRLSLRGRTIYEPNERKAREDVNPAKDGALGGLGHDAVLYVLSMLSHQAGDNVDKLFEHPRPAKLGTLKRLIAEGLGDVEAGVLEMDARCVALGFETEAHGSILDRPSS